MKLTRPVTANQCRRCHIIAATTLALFILCEFVGAVTARADAKSKPNIVFILADDLGYGDVGCFGQKQIKTPNLDQMAAEGMRFTASYASTSVCAPSRGSLMVGQHTGHAPIRSNKELPTEGQIPLPEGTFTVAKLLKSTGYKTAAFGKWGLGFVDSTGAPDKMGFDYFFGYNCQRQAHNYYPDHLWRNSSKVDLDEKTYSPKVMSDEVSKWLRENGRSPFFLYLPYTLPHGKYEIDDVGQYKSEPWPDLIKKYAAMVSWMDADIGRVMSILKELGVDDNTLVLFASDNGPASKQIDEFFGSRGGLRGIKRSMYEGGLRSPSIARWPGKIKAGSTDDTPWCFYDFLPTCAELANAKLPRGYSTDGLSILPMLLGGKMPEREFLYWELHERGFIQAVRSGQWKAVQSGSGNPVELYNLSVDPTESEDISAKHPEMVAKLVGIMKREHIPSEIWPDPTPKEAKAVRTSASK